MTAKRYDKKGKNFERDIGKIQQAAELLLLENLETQPKVRKLNEILVGSKHARILMKKGDSAEDSINIDEQLVEEVVKSGNDALKALVGTDFVKNKVIKGGKDGKPDTLGNKTIIVDYSLKDDKITRVLQLLASANTTLKDYSSIRFSGDNAGVQSFTKVKLGNTTSYVAIMGALSSLNLNSNINKDNLFYNGLYYGVVKNVEEINYHLNHLQFIYELTGAGLSYDGINFLETDFLIINDPMSNNIKVLSVKDMVNQELKKKQSPYVRKKEYIRENKDVLFFDEAAANQIAYAKVKNNSAVVKLLENEVKININDYIKGWSNLKKAYVLEYLGTMSVEDAKIKAQANAGKISSTIKEHYEKLINAKRKKLTK